MAAARILADNVEAIRCRIAAAAERSGRPSDAVRLVAVTKSAGMPALRALHALGVRHMAENRAQALWERVPQLPADIAWHAIGPLQTNKVRRTLPMVSRFDAVDRWELAECLDREAGRLGQVAEILLEANLTGESAKHGFQAGELEELWPRFAELANVRIAGVMGMASIAEDAADCRPVFAGLRQLRDRLAMQPLPNCLPGLPALSMGMSDDFEAAIEEGATEVRIGSLLFAGVDEAALAAEAAGL